MKKLLSTFFAVLFATSVYAIDITPQELVEIVKQAQATIKEKPRVYSLEDLQDLASGAEAAAIRGFDALTGDCATCLDSVGNVDGGSYSFTMDDATKVFTVHYFVDAGDCLAVTDSPFLIEPVDCATDTIKGYWKLMGSIIIHPSPTPGVTGRDSDESNVEVWKLFGNANDANDAYFYVQVREDGALVAYITLDGVLEKVLISKSLDLGANTFTVNSIEIVGADGEVNKAAVEDSGNWDTAYTHSSSDGSDHTYIDQDVTKGSRPIIGIPQYKDGAADGDIAALNDTTSVGTDGDPLELTADEVTGGTISNLGASGALFYRFSESYAIGQNVIFNVDVAENINLKAYDTDRFFWKAYDEPEFAALGADVDIQCDETPTIGDRVFCQARKVASTIEMFCWSDCNGCVSE